MESCNWNQVAPTAFEQLVSIRFSLLPRYEPKVASKQSKATFGNVPRVLDIILLVNINAYEQR